tara:strand:- start:107 stop:358 length:252 start_codon:yes stop_codon:yes gene_type:complete
MKTLKAINDFGKSILYYLFYAPVLLMFYVLCRMHNEEGEEFWSNIKFNTFTLISSIGWWLFILAIITGLFLAGLSRSIPDMGI